MTTLDPVFDRFVRAIDLPAYLGHVGYVVDEGAPAGERLAMVDRATGHRLELEKDLQTRGWTYSDSAHPGRRSTIADLLHERGLTPARAAEHLIACVDDRRLDDPDATRYREYVRAKPQELIRAVDRHVDTLNRTAAATRVLQHLGIRRAAIDHSRFGKLATEVEVSVALNDPPVAWFSKHRPTDKTLVITERPIDAIAHDQVKGDQKSCYMALGDRSGHERRETLEKVLRGLPPGMSVVLASGDHSRGRQLAQELHELAPGRLAPPQPPPFGNSWGDYAHMQERHRKSLARGPELRR